MQSKDTEPSAAAAAKQEEEKGKMTTYEYSVTLTDIIVGYQGIEEAKKAAEEWLECNVLNWHINWFRKRQQQKDE